MYVLSIHNYVYICTYTLIHICIHLFSIYRVTGQDHGQRKALYILKRSINFLIAFTKSTRNYYHEHSESDYNYICEQEGW